MKRFYVLNQEQLEDAMFAARADMIAIHNSVREREIGRDHPWGGRADIDRELAHRYSAIIFRTARRLAREAAGSATAVAK